MLPMCVVFGFALVLIYSTWTLFLFCKYLNEEEKAGYYFNCFLAFNPFKETKSATMNIFSKKFTFFFKSFVKAELG